MAKIGIVLINYNSTALTKACVKSLFAQKDDRDTYHIVVVDNDSKKKPTQNDFPDCDLILSTKNMGFAQGNNVGAAHLERKFAPQYLLILNNDTRVTSGMVRSLVEFFQRKSDAGIVLPKILFEKNHEFFNTSYTTKQKGTVIWYMGGDIDWKNMILSHRGVDEIDRGQFSSEAHEETQFATGCCMLTAMKYFVKIGGFDEKYFLYYEDADFSMRLKKRLGKKIYVDHTALLYHQNAGSSSGSGSKIHEYYQTRNRLRFGLSYAPLHTKISLLLWAKRVYKSSSKTVRRGLSDVLGGKWGYQSAQ